MQLIINLPEKVMTAIQNGEDYRYDIHTAIAQGIPYEERPQGDLISRKALIREIGRTDEWYKGRTICNIIDNAPTAPDRPQGEWVRKEDVIHSIAKQYSEHNELVPIWLSIGDIKGGNK